MRDYRGQGKGIDTPKARWVYGDKFEINGRCYIVLDDAKLLEDGHTGCLCLLGFVEVIPATVGQSTGLTDKDDVMIYKGDKMEYVGYECIKCGQECKYPNHPLYIIEYDEEEAGFVCWDKERTNYMHPNCWGSEMKVVGTIHDNPDRSNK